MKADFRISVKDSARGKILKVQLARVPFSRQFFVRHWGHPHLTPALSPPSEGAERAG